MGNISLTDSTLTDKKRTYVAIGLKNFYSSKECVAKELLEHPDWEADYIAATPRMAEYIRVSSEIYSDYLKYIAPEDNYDDIINLPHHVSQRHPRMSMYNRAAQFSPFAALTGYEKAIEEARKKQEAEVRRRNTPVEDESLSDIK